jgi:uncharacterized protein
MRTGSTTYRTFWAHDRDEELAAFEQFVGFCERAAPRVFRTLHVYHYAAYEPSTLHRLMGFHATPKEEVDELLRTQVFVDLLQVVRSEPSRRSSSRTR